MHSAMFGRAALSFGALSLVACGDSPNQAPRFREDSLSLRVAAGELFRQSFEVYDPDGDTLDFEALQLPASASLSVDGPQRATLTWVPNPSLSGDTVRFTLTATDPAKASASLHVEATITLPQHPPELLSPNQVLFDPSASSTLRQEVHVADPDSREVQIRLLEGPQGLQLHRLDAKTALLTWRPTEQQLQTHLYEVLLSLDDGTHTTQVRLPVLILEGDLRCAEVSPPTVWIEQSGNTLHAYGQDRESYLSTVTLYVATNASGPFSAFEMLPQAERNHFALELPTHLASGRMYYYLSAQDADGLGNAHCNQHIREPAQGVWSLTSPALNTCPEDAFAPNTTLSEAASLSGELTSGLVLCPNRPDIWALPAALPGQTRYLTANPPLPFKVLSDTGETLPAQGSALPEAGAFLSLASQTAIAYQLHTLQLAQACAHPDDGNDDVQPAQTLQAGSSRESHLCPLDTDLFRLAHPSSDTLEVTLSSAHSLDGVLLEHLHRDGSLLARSIAQGAQTSLTLIPSGSESLIRVRSLKAHDLAYTLEAKPVGPSCQDDLLQGTHTSFETAHTLFQGLYRHFVACPNAPDVFKVDLNGGETLTLLSAGGVTLEGFLSPHGQPTEIASPDARGDAQLELQAPPQVSTLYYRVRSSDVGRSYDLIQEVADPNSACTPDRFGAATQLNPAPIHQGLHTALRACPSNTRHYQVALDSADILTVLGSTYRGNGQLSLRLFDPQGDLVVRTQGEEGELYFEELIFAPGLYTLALSASGDAWFDLWLSID